jgi:hypothetical protein
MRQRLCPRLYEIRGLCSHHQSTLRRVKDDCESNIHSTQPLTEETQGLVTALDCGGVTDISGDVDSADHTPPLGKPEDLF